MDQKLQWNMNKVIRFQSQDLTVIRCHLLCVIKWSFVSRHLIVTYCK